MQSLRNYITLAEISEIVDIDSSKLDNKILIQAEEMVDAAIAVFYQGPFRKAFNRTYFASGTVSGANTLTITNAANTTNIFKGCVLQVMSGDKAGSKTLITANTAYQISFNEITGLTGEVDFRVYQAGKAPFYKDMYNQNKIVADEVKQAVAYQVEFMLANIDTPDSVKSKKGKKSENIGSSYSYTNEDKDNAKKSALELLAPQAAQILKDAGLTFQSI